MKLFQRKVSNTYFGESHIDFWNTTTLGEKTAGKFDTVDLGNPDHFDSFENFLLTFAQNAFQNNYFFNPQPSIIDNSKFVTNDACVISIIQKYQHALLVVESLSQGGRRMDWFDFIVEDAKPHASNSISHKLNHFSFGLSAHPQLLINKREVGMVRYCPTNNGCPLTNIPYDMTRAELFERLNWDKKTISWEVPKKDTLAMLYDIRADYAKTYDGKLKFKFCGHSSPTHKVAPDESLANCKTWVVNKLQSANIDVEIDQNNLLNRIVAHKIVTGHSLR